MFTDRVFVRLKKLVGASAATTYCWLRDNGQPAWFAWLAVAEQLADLGPGYQGGFACTKYRKRRV